MKNSTNPKIDVVAFAAILALSSATMLWLLWHYPIKTTLGTLIVLAAFYISARLTRLVDVDALADRERRNQNVST